MNINKTNLIESISLIKKNESFIDQKTNLYSNSLYTRKFNCNNEIAHDNSKNIWIQAYGCSANFADSEIISGLLQKHGYKIVSEEGKSDLNIIVTCSVKDSTEHKILHQIGNLTKSNKPLVVAGCLPKTERKKIEEINPNASLLGPNSLDKTLELVELAKYNKKGVFLADSNIEKINLPRIRINKAISMVQIATGCLSQCSFCQTKIAKGRLKSYRLGSIIRQVKNDISEGYKEIWLTSTDNGCYGKDINSTLVELLDSCASISGNYKLRVGMMNPIYLTDLLDGLIRIYKESDKIFKFIHIPVQSGSQRILKKMFRGDDINSFKNIISKFRKEIPEVTIATDIIVGFPGESDADFNSTKDLIRETKPDIVNISKYSSRYGTQSSKLKKIRSDIVKNRTTVLHTLCRSISKERNSLWKNWQGDIFLDEINNNIIQGRNYAYKSVIIQGDSSKLAIGDIVTVKILNYSAYSLFGKLI